MLIGMIVPFAGPSTDDLQDQGWLLCDGSEVPRAVYADLFGVIGGSWGVGDNVGTFNLPDLRGYFMRGVDHGADHDPDAAKRAPLAVGGNSGDAVGSYQADDTATHTHPYAGWTADTNCWDRGGCDGGFVVDSASLTTGNPTPAPDPSPTASGTETRPKNVNVEFLICWKIPTT